MTDNNHYAIETRNLNIYYEDFQAVKDGAEIVGFGKELAEFR